MAWGMDRSARWSARGPRSRSSAHSVGPRQRGLDSVLAVAAVDAVGRRTSALAIPDEEALRVPVRGEVLPGQQLSSILPHQERWSNRGRSPPRRDSPGAVRAAWRRATSPQDPGAISCPARRTALGRPRCFVLQAALRQDADGDRTPAPLDSSSCSQLDRLARPGREASKDGEILMLRHQIRSLAHQGRGVWTSTAIWCGGWVRRTSAETIAGRPGMAWARRSVDARPIRMDRRRRRCRRTLVPGAFDERVVHDADRQQRLGPPTTRHRFRTSTGRTCGVANEHECRG
jgi:hypothetical protein